MKALFTGLHLLYHLCQRSSRIPQFKRLRLIPQFKRLQFKRLRLALRARRG